MSDAPDWSTIPAPEDDGAAAHLEGRAWPAITLPGTDGQGHDISKLRGTVVVFVYPKTGRPGAALPDGWDEIPGARGCTPQVCSFRDLSHDLADLGVGGVFGLSTQDTTYQAEAAERLRLPFPLLSDENLVLADELNLPRMRVDGMRLLKRMALVIEDGRIAKVFYPVFPPDRNAADVLDWLRSR